MSKQTIDWFLRPAASGPVPVSPARVLFRKTAPTRTPAILKTTLYHDIQPNTPTEAFFSVPPQKLFLVKIGLSIGANGTVPLSRKLPV